jgi:hypothetical protein
MQKKTTMKVNTYGILIASLKNKYIIIPYKTPESTKSLDEPFLDQFRIEHRDFKTLMDEWFMEE